MELKQICIVTQSHLCRNPRVLKEALALSDAGYGITIINSTYDQQLSDEDNSLIKDTNIKLISVVRLEKKDLRSIVYRLAKRIADTLVKKFAVQTYIALGYGGWRYKTMALKQNADLYICHQELGTYCGIQLLKAKKTVAFDIEDWYSEDLLADARKARPIKLLKKMEAIALEKSVLCYTTSKAMALGLSNFYKVNRIPEVIYNSFPAGDLVHKKNTTGKIRLYWFSQTIGHGRGLEFFINCLSKVSASWELTLRGNISSAYHNSLKEIISPKDSLIILPIQKNEELLNDMANYDFGLALEPNVPMNKNLTISNKLFHYMAAGLPVIVSNTLGQMEIAEAHNDIIFSYKNDDQSDLVRLLSEISTKTSYDIDRLKKKVTEIHMVDYSWNIEAEKLVNLIKNAIEPVG